MLAEAIHVPEHPLHTQNMHTHAPMHIHRCARACKFTRCTHASILTGSRGTICSLSYGPSSWNGITGGQGLRLTPWLYLPGLTQRLAHTGGLNKYLSDE